MILSMRPLHCPFCTHVFYGFEPVANISDIDLAAENDTRENVMNVLSTNPITYVLGIGHGNTNVFTGENLQVIFSTDDAALLANKHVYLHACLTGIQLGKEIFNSGARSYAGFVIEWVWAFTPDETGNFKYKNPYDDPQAKWFFMAQNTYPLNLPYTTPQNAYNKTINAYNSCIDELLNSDNKYAGQLVGLLALDRDGFVLYAEVVEIEVKPIEAFVKSMLPSLIFAGFVQIKEPT